MTKSHDQKQKSQAETALGLSGFVASQYIVVLCGGVPNPNAQQDPARLGQHTLQLSHSAPSSVAKQECGPNYSKEIGNTYFYMKSSLG